MPVVVVGFVSLPEVGDILETVETKTEAKSRAEKTLLKSLRFKSPDWAKCGKR